MQSYVNEPFLEKRAKYAKWGSYVGLGALVIGLLTTNSSFLVSYLFLFLGLAGAMIGSYMANQYVREPRADKVLAEALSGLDKRYALYHHYLPSSHVIASHHGLTVIEPRLQKGEITYEGGKWHHKAGFRKVLHFFGEPTLGKPEQDLEIEIEQLKKWIDESMAEQDIPVNGVIVFTNPQVELSISGQPVPTMAASELARFMKEGLKGQSTLSTAKQKELRRILDEVIAQE